MNLSVRTFFAFLRFHVLLLLAIFTVSGPLTATGSVESVRGSFAADFARLDLNDCEQSLGALDNSSRAKATKAKLHFELARLCAYTAALSPAENSADVEKAERMLRVYLPGGEMASSVQSKRGQMELARLLMKTGRSGESLLLLRSLAFSEDPVITEMALHDAMYFTALEAQDLPAWIQAADAGLARLGGGTLEPLQEKTKVSLTWRRDFMKALLEQNKRGLPFLNQQIQFHYVQLEILQALGKKERCAEEWQALDAALANYFSALAQDPELAKKETPFLLLQNKLRLAQLKCWTNKPHEALPILDEILARRSEVAAKQANIISAARLWKITASRMCGASTEEEEAQLMALLSDSSCSSEVLLAAARRLSMIAQERGDFTTAMAWLKDLAELLPNPGHALRARQLLEKLKSEHSSIQLENLPPSAVRQIWSRKGLIQQKDGKNVFYSPRATGTFDARAPRWDWQSNSKMP